MKKIETGDRIKTYLQEEGLAIEWLVLTNPQNFGAFSAVRAAPHRKHWSEDEAPEIGLGNPFVKPSIAPEPQWVDVRDVRDNLGTCHESRREFF